LAGNADLRSLSQTVLFGVCPGFQQIGVITHDDQTWAIDSIVDHGQDKAEKYQMTSALPRLAVA
jgi:hypothetical protein